MHIYQQVYRRARYLNATLMISDLGFQILDFRFQISDLGFQLLDLGFQISKSGFQIPNSWILASSFRLQALLTSDF